MMKAISSTDFGCPDLSWNVRAPVELCVVLTQDDAGKYACYCGIVPKNMTDGHKQHRVMGSGSKLAFRRAVVFFPDLHIEEYRA
jgi:hypothetical protein